MRIVASGSKSAFTLVEIMIVVAVIGIVSAIAIPNFSAYKETTVKNKCLADIRQMESALTMAISETDTSTINLSEDGIRAIIEPDYIKHMPHCQRGTYSTDDSGTVHCSVHSP